MKIRISYFYQIRNFKKYMLPMSVCISDPKWYHDFQGSNHIFTDKRGILNGLRLKPIIVQGKHGECGCPCEEKDPTHCRFLRDYAFELEMIDFDKMMKGITAFANRYKQQNKIKEEIIMVLIVYEAPDNKCSERQTLINYFNNHNIECKELDYPISKKRKEIEYEF